MRRPLLSAVFCLILVIGWGLAAARHYRLVVAIHTNIALAKSVSLPARSIEPMLEMEHRQRTLILFPAVNCLVWAGLSVFLWHRWRKKRPLMRQYMGFAVPAATISRATPAAPAPSAGRQSFHAEGKIRLSVVTRR